MTNIVKNYFQAHPFHLVSPSPWPLYSSINLFTLAAQKRLNMGVALYVVNETFIFLSVFCAYFYSDIIQTYLNRVYDSIEWAFQSPPKPHSFVSLPLYSSLLTDALEHVMILAEKLPSLNFTISRADRYFDESVRDLSRELFQSSPDILRQLSDKLRDAIECRNAISAKLIEMSTFQFQENGRLNLMLGNSQQLSIEECRAIIQQCREYFQIIRLGKRALYRGRFFTLPNEEDSGASPIFSEIGNLRGQLRDQVRVRFTDPI